MIDLSVIIINYNGKHYLKDCIESLIYHLKGLTYEIIIWDNHSSDGSQQFIEDNYPQIILSKSRKNLGFGLANNKAVERAKGEHLLLINNDTVVLSDVKPILDVYKYSNNVGFLGIKMLDGNKKYLSSVGVFPTLKNMFRLKYLNDKRQDFKTGDFVQESYIVDWLTGAFMMVSTSLYKSLDGFDPNYFMYVEDVDICKRAHDRGLTNFFYPKAQFKHFVGFKSERNLLLIKGYQTYINKHYNGLYKLLLLLVLSFNAFIKQLKVKIK